ncbi:hypothetical protein B7486_15505 [cyanobacterium TDX16]|nr:hypothetical protein B7486_15505 [cyanobacterium TDX16]
MSEIDYDDPKFEQNWCNEQRNIVAAYLLSQKVVHGRIGDWPAWHVVPYVSIWAIESKARPEWIGWWVVSGDLPTDYISSTDVKPSQHPRRAMQVFSQKWLELVNAWKDGREVEDMSIGDENSREELIPLLEARSRLLMRFVEDDSYWGVD